VLRAIIFDFDGVLADDEHIHLESFQHAFGEFGVVLDEQVYYERYLGFDDRECVRQVLCDQGRPDLEPLTDELVAGKGRAFMEAIERGVPLFPGAAEFVRRAATRCPLAIASGALHHEIEAILVAGGLRGHFAAIASADDIAVGKPDPAVFHLALAKLNETLREPSVKSRECVVIEDSMAGVEGAKRAGMHCVAVTNSYDAEALGRADLVVSSLEGLEVSALETLVGG
jgi:HAD superfamily hydrolase (TIGR01509 family)